MGMDGLFSTAGSIVVVQGWYSTSVKTPDDKMALGVLRPLNTGWFWNPDGDSFVLWTRSAQNITGFIVSLEWRRS